MPKLPRVTGKEAIRAFEKAGFVLSHIEGSHHVLKRAGHPYHLTIPVHSGKPIGCGLLLRLIKNAGLTKEQFIELL
jgi:predicted RNA binding protein YcfA (HicA-like mRNA interferase family)